MKKYPKPSSLSKSQIDRFGDILRAEKTETEEYQNVLSAINIWRQSHFYPMNTFQSTLRRKIKEFDVKDFHPIAAQRLKRMPAIMNKLQRGQTEKMRLSRMQDIGGLRAILKDVEQVYKLRDYYTKSGRFNNYNPREKDYLGEPKPDGYRGIHLIFTYNNVQSRSECARLYKGLHIELQIRTELEHIWATAVETVGTILGENLKSDQGEDCWLRFFKLMSEVFAVIEHEQTPRTQIYFDEEKFKHNVDNIKRLDKQHKILDSLQGWSMATNEIHTSGFGGFYNLIVLDYDKKTVNVKLYSENDVNSATKDYAKQEALSKNTNQVLVSTSDLKNLRKAYPNYFLDIQTFINYLRWVLGVDFNIKDLV
ncbi:MAG: RelA/SpoT domain-containing protein [Candidatus Nomurabacteria bacterium]|jgi:ppGpp synthetase/RelA/SpoT-type nucleotidyltranferase|nr:RelA/SpoT domain-containing protein [Candidatus Nomurabacteria bacterium]